VTQVFHVPVALPLQLMAHAHGTYARLVRHQVTRSTTASRTISRAVTAAAATMQSAAPNSASAAQP